MIRSVGKGCGALFLVSLFGDKIEVPAKYINGLKGKEGDDAGSKKRIEPIGVAAEEIGLEGNLAGGDRHYKEKD